VRRLKSNNQLKLREPQRARAIVIINNFITQRRSVAHLNITSPLTVAQSAGANQSRLPRPMGESEKKKEKQKSALPLPFR